MFNKISRKNTLWNKIKCYVTLHTVSVMFSHVFLAVCKIQSVSTIGIQSVKVQKEFWKRFDPLPPSWFCFLALALNVYDVIYAAALRMQNYRCMTSKHRESYREQTAPTDLYIMTAPHAFESLSRYFDVIQRSSAQFCFKSNTHTFRPLLELQSANFSPPPLRKNKIMK